MLPSTIRKKLQVQQKEASKPNRTDEVEKSPPSKSSRRTSENKSTRSPSNISGKASVGTKRSQIRESFVALYEQKLLGGREWIIVLVEIFVTYSCQVLRNRLSTQEAALRLRITRRELNIRLLFVNGWASILTMVAGIISDCYLGPHGLVLASIWVNFIMIGILFVEEIIRTRIKFNPYFEVVSTISAIAIIISNSTDYSRMVFGLENLRSRKKSIVVLLVFILILVGDKPKSGGLLMLLTSYLNLENFSQLSISFCGCGISLILLYNVPRSPNVAEFSFVGRKVIKCIYTSTLGLFKSPAPKVHWMNRSLLKCDRHTAFATKELLILCLMILPTLGYTFFLKGQWGEGNLWEGIATSTYPSGFYKFTGTITGLQITIYLSMIIAFFVLIPLLQFVGIRKKFTHQFVAGYLIGLCTFWYATSLVKAYESAGSAAGVGHVRILNTRKDKVDMVTIDNDFSEINLSIKPQGVVMLTFSVDESILIRTNITFNETESFNTFLDVTPKKCSAYVLVEPPELLRIAGFIPIWEGIPEANNHMMARLYVFTAARTHGVLIFKYMNTKEVMEQRLLSPGRFYVFEVPPGRYEASLGWSRVKKELELAPGSVYGLIIYADYHSDKLIVDQVIPGKVAPAMLLAAFGVGYGTSISLAYVAFNYMVFLRAPTGLVSTTFAYMSSQENLTHWILLIGFRTWHEHVTGHVIMMYAFFLSFLFFLCIFIFVKYTNVYSVYIIFALESTS